MSDVKLEKTVQVSLTVTELAELFAHMDDDQQCRFFVEVARIAQSFKGGADAQWWYVGGHLRNCECSTQEARDMIVSLYHYMNTSTHQ